jgi:hypothetical protein
MGPVVASIPTRPIGNCLHNHGYDWARRGSLGRFGLGKRTSVSFARVKSAEVGTWFGKRF